ncbi:cysteine hydrolase [Roseibaca sp. V10]|uniref:Cysteine hydrolase n=1 Tax=Roseinatronobacter domitianus TaxID=2940293 RepID=A0ABT0LWY5_9RHOB|nr:cysteine hydrolase family protein [Roseibaca domitiana]MCL1627129.1 cysteine hydrolase [Roseibaca domitiana]
MKMDCALVLIDFQVGFEDPAWGARNNPDAEAKAARLLTAWRATGAPVVHVRHLSKTPGSPLSGTGTAWMPALAPLEGETCVEKSVNAAFIGTGLEAALRAQDVTDLVIAGLTTPHCVSTTCRMAANLGFRVILAHDACAAFAANADESWQGTSKRHLTPDAIHNAAISHLHGEFVTARAVTDILTQ